MEKSSLIIITLCVAAALALSAIIKRYDSDRSDNQQQPKDIQPKCKDIS